MSKVLFRARDRFAGDQRGNVGMIFAFAAVPMIGLLGGAVDMTRHHRYKAELLNAMDAAAIALAKRGAESDADADAFVNDYIAAMTGKILDDGMLHVASFNAVQIEGGWRVESDGSMDAAFLPVVGIGELPLDLSAEVRTSGRKYEIALALDNTGSMRNHGRIEALRDAAGDLVDNLYADPGAEDRVKMALVPFVTAVNIKTEGVFQSSWIEGSVDPDLDWNFRRPDGEPVDRLELFDQMGVAWKGCVEARRVDDEDDTLPDSAETRWVPYLWPDEPDDRGYGNDYLDDSASGGDRARLRHVGKYDSGEKPVDTTSKGPNAACPRAIVELTNDKERMHDEIELMKPHNEFGGNNSGTNVAQGLMWAWRVLSPDEPFSQGVSYEDKETQKVLVLLSDGRNQVVSNDEVTESDYTSYGYLAEGRMGSTNNYRTAEKTIDAKIGRICEKIKGKGIRLYTILFQVDFEETQDIFRTCASTDEDGDPLYYYVPSAEALQTAFAEIGKDMTQIYLSR
jgi:Mg-chelatase subunit ChlD